MAEKILSSRPPTDTPNLQLRLYHLCLKTVGTACSPQAVKNRTEAGSEAEAGLPETQPPERRRAAGRDLPGGPAPCGGRGWCPLRTSSSRKSAEEAGPQNPRGWYLRDTKSCTKLGVLLKDPVWSHPDPSKKQTNESQPPPPPTSLKSTCAIRKGDSFSNLKSVGWRGRGQLKCSPETEEGQTSR